MNGLSEVSVGDEDPAPRMKRTQRYTHEASCCGRIYHRWVSRKGESLAGDQVCPACRKRLTWERQFGWHSPLACGRPRRSTRFRVLRFEVRKLITWEV